jgi:hypothetical protein
MSLTASSQPGTTNGINQPDGIVLPRLSIIYSNKMFFNDEAKYTNYFAKIKQICILLEVGEYIVSTREDWPLRRESTDDIAKNVMLLIM